MIFFTKNLAAIPFIEEVQVAVMELTGVAGKCRACQKEFSEEIQIPIYSQKNLTEIFHDVTSIKIDKKDKLPGVLCPRCYVRLLDAHEFRQMCAVSAMKFHRILLQDDTYEQVQEIYPAKKINENKKIRGRKPTLLKEKSSPPPVTHPTEYVSADLPAEDSEALSSKQEVENEDTLSENPESSESDTIPLKVKPNILPENAEPATVENSLANRRCCVCQQVFERPSALMTHLITIHKSHKFKACMICGKDCLSTSKLDEHLREVHEITDSLTCKICKKTLQHRFSLWMHFKIYHTTEGHGKSRKYICEECGKVFVNKTALTRHKYSHSGIRPHACPHCPKRFVTNARLTEHKMRHSGIKNHVCPFCGLRKTTANELKVHINYHTREKTHTCQYCEAVFCNKDYMKRHIKVVHMKTLSYPCTTCGRAFGKKETLKHHIMTHTGEKPEKCEVCGKAFIQRVALKKHMQTHEKRK